ncbi:MAG: hypothetical protein CL610_08420 [Anaerolineaceae bacterium]|nr:hypothetical protein [Anaerolineaceae bacterium]
MVVDCHTHIIVPEILRSTAPGDDWRPAVRWQNDQQIIDFAGKQIRSAVRDFVHIEQILENQAGAGVDHVVLSPWVSLVGYDQPAAAGLQISQIQNEGLLQIAGQYPEQVSVLGTVPLQTPDIAADVLVGLMAEPGIIGVEIAASVNGDYLGHERLRPFWAAADETGAVVFVHPTTRGFDLPVLNDYYLWNTAGNPLETAITAAHMVMSGLMEQYPNLKVVLAHGGGALMALRGRLRHAHTFQPQARAQLTHSPDESLRRFYYDSLTHDAGLLHDLLDFVGDDHVLLGSDYPFDMGDNHAVQNIRALGLPAATVTNILSRNFSRLINSTKAMKGD